MLDFTADALPLAEQSLDYALIRLARPVGQEPIGDGGGRIRGWIEMPENIAALTGGWRIVIPQHPQRQFLQLDIGRFTSEIGKGTRIAYTTNAAHGSSGSPCFDAQFNLVGLHNAGLLNLKVNQAIRIDRVRAHIGNVVGKFEDIPTSLQLWSVSDDASKPKPLLGRKALRSAIAELSEPQSARRVVVIEEETEDDKKAGKNGKTFSVDILSALIRDSGHVAGVLRRSKPPARAQARKLPRERGPPAPAGAARTSPI